MRYSESTLEYFDAAVDDEYERMMLHRSSTVSMYLMIWLCFVTGALLAWVLPGWLSVWSVLLFLPPLVGNLVGERWLKQYAPRPNYPGLRRRDWAMGIPVLFVWMTGVVVNAFDGSALPTWGMIAGGVVGGLVANRVNTRHSARNRRRDRRRLNTGLDD